MKKSFLTICATILSVMLCVAAPSRASYKEENKMPIDYSKYKVIDFDATYGECSGKQLAANIAKAVGKSNGRTMILFNGAEYDLEGAMVSISKSVVISGKIPAKVDLTKMGHTDIKSSFINAERFNLRGDNITVANLNIVKPNREGVLFFLAGTTGEEMPEGLLLFNLRLEGSSSQINGRNGAGVRIRNVSCIDFTRAGYIVDKRSRVDEIPQAIIEYSLFDGYGRYYDTRGISFDSGNTEYPVVTNLNNTTINRCHFIASGIGFSKARNVQILNSVVEGDNLYMDMIHMEEFTHDILIKGNRFVYLKPSRGFYIDRERQSAWGIEIIDNTFEGKIGWVISTYSPRAIRFEGNDFSKADFSLSDKHITFDFTYYHFHREKPLLVPYEIATKELTMRNNKGIEGASMRIYQEKGDSSNIIEGLPKAESIEVLPIKPILKDGRYYIQNKAGKYLSIDGSGSVIVSAKRSKAALWDVNFYELQNYTIRSVQSGNLLDVHNIFTLGHMRTPAKAPHIQLTQSESYNDKSRQMAFYIEDSKSDIGGYALYPAGNERKSRVVTYDDGTVGLEMRYTYPKGAGTPQVLTPLSKASQWQFTQE